MIEPPSVDAPPPPLFTLLWRAWGLRCAQCGQGKLFRGWFTMNDACGHCGASFQREPGFYLGSIYFNYGLTAILVTAIYCTLNFGFDVSPEILLPATAAFTVLFPLWYFRRARSVWLAFDQYFDPRPRPKLQREAKPASEDQQP
ncbi:MAG TPA: DUF983 domain-containing protein [Pirellulales bacterium]|jgi:uncharacterized protein (DUF983 family)|nr:DUF983 domain-containing protein [Pirellulales bacterium]